MLNLKQYGLFDSCRLIIFFRFMFTSETTVRVRYNETDKMGYVYHGNYAQYFEIGRTDALRQVGLTYKEFEENGVMMPVIHLQSTYIKPARYDDLLTVKTIIKKLPGVKTEFYFEIRNQDDVLITTGEVFLVNIDIQTNRPTRCPKVLMDKLIPYF
jgi:acyl-CoA thioester hydrolase